MPVKSSVVDAIGNTPLIRLRRVSEQTGCEILGKAEFLNPGQSVKDRPARQIILEAEKRGEVRPGGLIVEATAGNTGIGLAMVGGSRGYRTTIVIPETQSEEKKDALRMAGAKLIEVAARPYNDPDNYQHVAQRLAGGAGRDYGGPVTAIVARGRRSGTGSPGDIKPEDWALLGGAAMGAV